MPAAAPTVHTTPGAACDRPPEGQDSEAVARPGGALAGSSAALGWWLGALGVLCFALTIPMTRLASGTLQAPQLSATFVAIGRAALGGLLAALWLLAVRAPLPRPAQWRQLGLTSLGVVFGFPLFLGLAVQRVDAAHAAVVSGLLPISTAAIGAVVMRQQPGARFWACALVGMGLVLGFALWRGNSGLQVADGLLLLAVVWGGFGYVMGARLSAPQGSGQPPMAPEHVISWVLVLCLPVTLPVAWAHWPAQPVRASAWGGYLYVSVVSVWLGFFAWYRGLQLGGMLRVSQVQLLQPFLAMVLAVPVLGEPLDAATIGFAVAVMVTVLVSRRLPSPVARAASPDPSSTRPQETPCPHPPASGTRPAAVRG